ncbi:ABC transporter permease [Pimelobacter simplex]|uniref:Putative glutathione transporter, permease component n=1 Tax=Nocardioides simplex TaxID=2045 RepID=A0A0C5XKH3_NOCSI|nr:ABC transporter permease [Pimelobacter simplex]AJR17992.1 Putative glutathione transporter, permease component [Pimelobacter simplex]GEB15032.1 peptide ABC transporter permease [Pimelobacter simplex]SFM87345.1 peptide/nickel transport system permease protein [Pimelobacter simplex]
MTAAAPVPAPVPTPEPAPAKRRRRRRGGRWTIAERLSAGWLILLVGGMLVLPTLRGIDPLDIGAESRFAKLSPEHWLGADNLGRDLLARALDGAQVSVLIGVGSVLIAALIGVPLGMLSAYYGGVIAAVISFVVDVILAFPGLVLALGLASFLGASVTNVMIAITVPMFPVFVRLARAQTLALLETEYLEASEVIGTPVLSIMRRDVLPNISEAILAFGFVSIGRAILIEGSLSFLGIGVPRTQPTWGGMINEGRIYMTTDPLLILVPGAFLLLTILSLNLISDRFLVDGDAVTGARA